MRFDCNPHSYSYSMSSYKGGGQARGEAGQGPVA